jgi:hypothetical protein
LNEGLVEMKQKGPLVERGRNSTGGQRKNLFRQLVALLFNEERKLEDARTN